jgi:hypothetical protein
MTTGRFRLFAIKCTIILVTLLVGLGFMEVVLRTFPSLISLDILARMEPTMRTQIANRLGLPTIESTVQITSAMRTDGGPPFNLPGPNTEGYGFADPADLALGAAKFMKVDQNGLCNTPEKASRTKSDIVVAGDSFTACTAIVATQSATHRLEELSGFTVYNAGIGNTGPDEYLEMLKRFAPQFHPTITIINIYEGNDLRDVLRKKRFIESGGKDARNISSPAPAWSYATQFLTAGFEVAYRYVESNVEHNFRYSAPVGGATMLMNITNKDQGEVQRAYELREGKISTDSFAAPMKAYVEWAKSQGAVPIVTYIPSMYTVYEGTVSFEDADVGQTVKAFSAAQRKWFAENAAAIGYNYIDLTPFFQQTAATGVVTHFPANVHLTPQGYDLVAVNTWEFLKKLGLTPAAPQ